MVEEEKKIIEMMADKIEDILKKKNKIYYSKNELLNCFFNKSDTHTKKKGEDIINRIIKNKQLNENKFYIVNFYDSLKEIMEKERGEMKKIIKMMADKIEDILKKKNKIYYSKNELLNCFFNKSDTHTKKKGKDIINRIIQNKQLNENKFYIVDLYNSLSSNPIYDLIIDIKSVLKLKDGWDIIFEGNEENVKRVKDCIDKDKRIVAVIGHSNRGKTYLLHLISNIENIKYVSNYSYQTKGISMKFPENTEVVLLDSYGGNAPNLVEDEKNDIRDKEKSEYEKELKKIKDSHVITNYLIQNFIINEATFIVCVIGLLSSEEQKYIHNIKNQCINAGIDKELLIVHNLYMYSDVEQVKDYIKNTLLKSLTFKLEQHKVPIFNDYKRNYYRQKNNNNDNDKNLENIYFRETIEGKKIGIIHLILVNEEIENAKLFNYTTINFLMQCLNQAKYKKFSVVETFKNFIIKKSNEVFNEKLNENDIYEENNKLKVKKEITPKSIKIDVSDMVKFIEVKYVPPYYFYYDKDKKYLFIKIQTNSMCEKIESKYSIFEEGDQIKFEIKGHKLCQGRKSSKKKRTIVLFNEKRKENDFEIVFYIERNNISFLEEEEKNQKEGFYILKYRIYN